METIKKKKTRVRLFSESLGNRTRGNRNKLKYRKFYLNVRVNILTVEVVKQQSGIPRKCVESPFSEILKTQQKEGLADVALSRGVGLVTYRPFNFNHLVVLLCYLVTEV